MAHVSGHYFSLLPRLVPTILLAATFTVGTAAQEGKTQWLPREEMIGAIIGFAASHCGKVDGLLAALIEPHCKDPTAGFAVHMVARMALGSESDEALAGPVPQARDSGMPNAGGDIAGATSVCAGLHGGNHRQPHESDLEPR
jgi:hypothetical protein